MTGTILSDYIERCEKRAMATKHRAWMQDDGSINVHSESRDDVWHNVTFEEILGYVRFYCTCESGDYRASFLIPCWHACKAGRRLMREGLAYKEDDGTYRVTPKALSLLDEVG